MDQLRKPWVIAMIYSRALMSRLKKNNQRSTEWSAKVKQKVQYQCWHCRRRIGWFGFGCFWVSVCVINDVTGSVEIDDDEANDEGVSEEENRSSKPSYAKVVKAFLILESYSVFYDLWRQSPESTLWCHTDRGKGWHCENVKFNTFKVYDALHSWKAFIEYFIVVINFWGYFNSQYFIYY